MAYNEVIAGGEYLGSRKFRPIYGDPPLDFYKSVIGTGYLSSPDNCQKCLKRF